MRRSLPFPALLLALLALAAPLRAQEVRGRVLEAATERPVRGAGVLLLAGDDMAVARATTDSLGEFALRAPAPGRYRLVAVPPGRAAVRSGPVEVGAEGADLDLRLAARPVQLEGITVSARRPEDPRLLGFLRRSARRTGGYFIRREEIERRRPVRIGDLLQSVPGLVVRTHPTNPAVPVVELRSSGMGRCPVLFYLDGLQASGFDLGSIRPDDVEGIEVYTHGGTIPAELNSRMGSSCGVVAIWTRI